MQPGAIGATLEQVELEARFFRREHSRRWSASSGADMAPQSMNPGA